MELLIAMLRSGGALITIPMMVTGIALVIGGLVHAIRK